MQLKSSMLPADYSSLKGWAKKVNEKGLASKKDAGPFFW
jgi:hypothetical protein